MNITLPSDLEQFVHERIAAGQAESPDDVISAALALLREREIEEVERIAALRADIDEGIAALDRGEGIPGDEAFARLYARRAARERA